MTTRKAIVLNEDATNRDAEDILELINVKGARVVTLTKVDQHELWQIATEGEAGDGSQPLPFFYVSAGHYEGEGVEE